MAPSLNYDAPIDAYIKSHLLADCFNLICLKHTSSKTTTIEREETKDEVITSYDLNDKFCKEFKVRY